MLEQHFLIDCLKTILRNKKVAAKSNSSDLVEGQNVTALDVLISRFNRKVVFDDVVNRHKIIHNCHHDCQFLDPIPNRYQLSCTSDFKKVHSLNGRVI